VRCVSYRAHMRPEISMMRLMIWACFCATVAAGAPEAPGAKTIADFESPASTQIRVRQTAPGSVEGKVAGSASGHYLSVSFRRSEEGGYAYVDVPVTAELARSAGDYDGISFKARGGASKTFGTIEIRTDEYRNIFQAVFTPDSTEWKEVTIRWDEFFQINDTVKEAPIGWKAINVFAFGSRAGWGTVSFDVDDIALAKIAARPKAAAPAGSQRLEKTIAKLRGGEVVKVVALGDSITFGTKVAAEKRKTSLYFQVAAAGLEKAFPGAKVTTINAGVGGDTIGEGIVRIGHQVAAENPDLVMVLLGANDAIYSFPDTRVRSTMALLIDKLLETTRAEVLLLGPTPAPDVPDTPERYSEVYRELAGEKNVAYVSLGDSLKRLPSERYRAAFGDGVHLSESGHRVCGEAMLDYILKLSR